MDELLAQALGIVRKYRKYSSGSLFVEGKRKMMCCADSMYALSKRISDDPGRYVNQLLSLMSLFDVTLLWETEHTTGMRVVDIVFLVYCRVLIALYNKNRGTFVIELEYRPCAQKDLQDALMVTTRKQVDEFSLGDLGRAMRQIEARLKVVAVVPTQLINYVELLEMQTAYLVIHGLPRAACDDPKMFTKAGCAPGAGRAFGRCSLLFRQYACEFIAHIVSSLTVAQKLVQNTTVGGGLPQHAQAFNTDFVRSESVARWMKALLDDAIDKKSLDLEPKSQLIYLKLETRSTEPHAYTRSVHPLLHADSRFILGARGESAVNRVIERSRQPIREKLLNSTDFLAAFVAARIALDLYFKKKFRKAWSELFCLSCRRDLKVLTEVPFVVFSVGTPVVVFRGECYRSGSAMETFAIWLRLMFSEGLGGRVCIRSTQVDVNSVIDDIRAIENEGLEAVFGEDRDLGAVLDEQEVQDDEDNYWIIPC